MAYELGKLVRADSSLNMAVGNALRIDEKEGKDTRTRIQRNSMMDADEPDGGYYMFSVSVAENKISVSDGILYYNLDPVEVPAKENVSNVSAGYLRRFDCRFYRINGNSNEKRRDSYSYLNRFDWPCNDFCSICSRY